MKASFGYESGAADEFLPMATDGPYPICKSYRTLEKIWIPATSETKYPLAASIWETAGAQALVTLPLVSDGRKIGAAGWAFANPRTFDRLDTVEFLAIAKSVSTALAVRPADGGDESPSSTGTASPRR